MSPFGPLPPKWVMSFMDGHIYGRFFNETKGLKSNVFTKNQLITVPLDTKKMSTEYYSDLLKKILIRPQAQQMQIIARQM